jgi:DtxR family Mn-dependent transcriptional regulator
MANFKNDDRLTDSLQDYLEAIGILIKNNKVARVKDIAEKLNVKLASVTGALKQLRSRGYIKYSPYSLITLTAKGEKLADNLISTHNLLKKLFAEIFLFEKKEAEKISCILEHYISDSSIRNIKRFMEFSDKYKIFEKFPEYLKDSKEETK